MPGNAERSFDVKTYLFAIGTLALLLSPLDAFSQQASRTPDNHPDLTGYWKSMSGDKFSFWHIGKDLPDRKLPFTPAGDAARKHNQTATIDPESLCIIGGIPRHNVTMMAFEILQGAKKVAFLYGDGSYRACVSSLAAKTMSTKSI